MKNKNLITKATNNWLIPRVRNYLPLWSIPEKNRRFKAYCVGTWKTGTTSIHAAFRQNYCSAHEPESGFLCNRLVAFANGKIDKGELIQFVKRREKWLGLEMNSGGLNYLLVDILVSEWNETKFILTIRDCYSWLDSFLNQHYRDYCYLQAHYSNFRKKWGIKVHEIIFGYDEFKHAPEEKILADNGLYTLDGYFRHWREHIQQVIATVPKERLLIVKTKEINQDLPKIEQFLGLISGSLQAKVHENVRHEKQKYYFLSKIDKDFLEAKANFYCQELMNKYFPEVKWFN